MKDKDRNKIYSNDQANAERRKPNMSNFTLSGLFCIYFHWSLLSLLSSVLCF